MLSPRCDRSISRETTEKENQVSRFQTRNIGSGMYARMADMIAQDEARKRSQLLDGIQVSDANMRRQQVETAMRRQAELDKRQQFEDEQADADRLAAINGPDTDISERTADVLRRAGYRVNSQGTLEASTLGVVAKPDGSMGYEKRELPSQQYSRRAETNKERVDRESIERDQTERREDQRREDMKVKDANAYRYMDNEQRRNEREEDAAARHEEAEANRRNQRDIANINASGRGGTDKQTEGQRRTAGLLSRARAARGTADKLEKSVSVVDMLAPNFMRSPNGQQYRQSAKQWIQSVLRDESGAAIGVDEEASYFETYFRQPGDSAPVIRQKREARDAAEDAMAEKAGTEIERPIKPMPSHSSGGNTSGGSRKIGRFTVEEN
jgi:hypothetical protein